MKKVQVSAAGATVTFDRGELLVLFGCLVEAIEALSPAEFQARIGRPETEAERLIEGLKGVMREVE
jgi:hypothetical protein